MRLPTRTGPSGRYGHTLNFLDPRLLVFGGQDEGTYFNELYILNCNEDCGHPSDPTADWKSWLPNDAYPDRPLARADHTMVSWDEKLYLYVLRLPNGFSNIMTDLAAPTESFGFLTSGNSLIQMAGHNWTA